jgi:hypothetical protein
VLRTIRGEREGGRGGEGEGRGDRGKEKREEGERGERVEEVPVVHMGRGRGGEGTKDSPSFFNLSTVSASSICPISLAMEASQSAASLIWVLYIFSLRMASRAG